MKNKGAYIIILLTILLLVTSISGSIKSNKLTYTTKDSIYVLSTVGTSDFLCRSSNPPESVSLYIVEHKDSWTDGDDFEDVRGEPNDIPNKRFSTKKVAENLQLGIYDLIVDCNEDKIYNEASEPLYNPGITIIAKKGQGTMSLGEKSKDDFIWNYDPENPKLGNEILQLTLVAKDEDIKLDELTIDFISPQTITNLEIFVDKNNDGLLNPVDQQIATLKSTSDKENVIPDYTISEGATENLLFIYKLDESTSSGDYGIIITSLLGTGSSSNEQIRFFGPPIESNTMNVKDPKTCVGSIQLELSPNPASPSDTITANILNLTGCDNKKVTIKSGPCYTEVGNIKTCKIEDDTCQLEIKSIPGDYFACINKNDDDDTTDFGESTISTLTHKSTPKNNIKETIELNEESDDQETEASPITGNVISESTGIPISNNIAIILEVTLILILIMLVLIFFKQTKAPITKTEDESDLFEEKKQETDNNLEEDKHEEIFEDIEKKKKEITDKVDKEIKDSKKK